MLGASNVIEATWWRWRIICVTNTKLKLNVGAVSLLIGQDIIDGGSATTDFLFRFFFGLKFNSTWRLQANDTGLEP